MMKDKKAYAVSLIIILILVIINGYLTFSASTSKGADNIPQLQIHHAKK